MRFDQDSLMKVLDQLYDKAIDGVPGLQGAEEIAKNYLEGSKPLEDKVDVLIRWQIGKTSTSGFLTGLGGVLTLPATVPANLSSVLYVQFQMVAAIAYMGGYDVRDDRVKTLCYVCLCGNAANEVLKSTGITIGTKLTGKAIKQLSYEVIKKINKAVGFRLITKWGQTGVINLSKTIPIAGGVVGGSLDGAATYTIGKNAKNLFISSAETLGDEHSDDGRSE